VSMSLFASLRPPLGGRTRLVIIIIIIHHSVGVCIADYIAVFVCFCLHLDVNRQVKSFSLSKT